MAKSAEVLIIPQHDDDTKGQYKQRDVNYTRSAPLLEVKLSSPQARSDGKFVLFWRHLVLAAVTVLILLFFGVLLFTNTLKTPRVTLNPL